MDEPDTKLLIFVLCKGRGKGRTLSRGTNWHLPFAENLILKPAFILFYILAVVCLSGVRKQSTFRDATTNFPSKWRLRKEGRNSMLTTYRYPDIRSASDWLDICFNQSEALFRSGLWVERHQYGSNYCASGFFTRTSRGETSGGISKCRLFSQAHFSGLGGCRPFFLFSFPPPPPAYLKNKSSQDLRQSLGYVIILHPFSRSCVKKCFKIQTVATATKLSETLK